MAKSRRSSVTRRGFLKGAAAGAAAFVAPDAQLSDIYAYIQTLKPAPSAKDIPVLNQLLK